MFCLAHLHRDYCVTCCDRADQAAFALALRERSQLTWQQLRHAPRHGLGSEKIARDSIRATIPEIAKGVDHFLAFRFSGLKPMVGLRRGTVFHIFWLDRDFTLYDHG